VTFGNRSNDMGLRVASLDYLGVVAAHLRRNSMLNMEQEQEDLLAIISEVNTKFSTQYFPYSAYVQ
jgi:hypothetical protein